MSVIKCIPLSIWQYLKVENLDFSLKCTKIGPHVGMGLGFEISVLKGLIQNIFTSYHIFILAS